MTSIFLSRRSSRNARRARQTVHGRLALKLGKKWTVAPESANSSLRRPLKYTANSDFISGQRRLCLSSDRRRVSMPPKAFTQCTCRTRIISAERSDAAESTHLGGRIRLLPSGFRRLDRPGSGCQDLGQSSELRRRVTELVRSRSSAGTERQPKR